MVRRDSQKAPRRSVARLCPQRPSGSWTVALERRSIGHVLALADAALPCGVRGRAPALFFPRRMVCWRKPFVALALAAMTACVVGGCEDGHSASCGGNGCATASCTPGATACSEDGTNLSICSASGTSVRQKTCIPPARCGSIGQEQYDCVTPDVDGGLDGDTAPTDAAAADTEVEPDASTVGAEGPEADAS
jgi:hypothetical protein